MTDLCHIHQHSPCGFLCNRDLVCLAFSPDSKTLLTLSGAPDWTLCVWNWEKPKPPIA
ncbi:hypothetical protein T492DRAFT_896240, partial [Pavlovales sp. CCMP2436]